jgi:aminopeptidase N
MYRTILGEDGFKKGLKLYIHRHDGKAATCEDFCAAMAGALVITT